MTEVTVKKMIFNDFSAFHLLFGTLDENIILLEKYFSVTGQTLNSMQERKVQICSAIWDWVASLTTPNP